MPRRFDMANLVLRCKRRADMEFKEHISDAEWKALISEQYGELYCAVAETGMRYFETTASFAATGAVSYDEPDDHLSTTAVRFIVNASTGERRELAELMVQEMSQWSTSGTGEARGYALIDDQLYLYPRPTSGTYELVYVPQPPDLSAYADADVIDVVSPDGESFLLWGVAIKALAKAEREAALAIRQCEAAKERLTTWAVLRAMNAPRRRVDPDINFRDPAEWTPAL